MPNIHVIDGIYNIKEKFTIHILIANCTNNKGQCIGHIEPSTDHTPQTAINSFTTQKMTDRHVQPDSFTHPLHTLLGDARKSINYW